MSQKDYDMKPRWYVVHTYSGYENKVKTDLEKTVKNRELEDYFFDIVVPMEEQIEIKDGKKKANLRKVFPAYVLIKMIVTEETWYIVRNTRGVTGFVGSGTDPIPLTDEEIRAMGFDESAINVDYEVGDSVKMLQGAFKSGIFCSAIALTCSLVIFATFSLFGFPDPFSIFIAFFINTATGGTFVMNSKDLSLYTVITTGIINPA